MGMMEIKDPYSAKLMFITKSASKILEIDPGQRSIRPLSCGKCKTIGGYRLAPHSLYKPVAHCPKCDELIAQLEVW